MREEGGTPATSGLDTAKLKAQMERLVEALAKAKRLTTTMSTKRLLRIFVNILSISLEVGRLH